MSAYLDIIILLFVVVMVFAKLKNLLGTRPENETEISNESAAKIFDILMQEHNKRHPQAEKGGDSPFSGILTDSSANSSVDTGQEAFTDEVVPSDGDLAFSSGGAEEQGSSGPADYVLTGHPELAQQARQWLSQQGLEPDEDGIYPLTVQQIQGLNAAVPELELPTDDALRLLLED